MAVPKISASDAAADAARLLERLSFVVLGLGCSVAEALSPRAVFVFFPIGIALILVAALLDGRPTIVSRLGDAAFSSLGFCGLALVGWAFLSLAWSPFPLEGSQHLFKLVGTALLAILAIACARQHMRATDLYLFPVGIALAMLAIVALAIATFVRLPVEPGRIGKVGLVLAVLVWPAMAGLAARGRTGTARLVLILAIAVTFAIGEHMVAAALLIGVLALSFAISDTRRTAFDLGLVAVVIIMLAPLAPAVAPALSRWIFHAKLSSLPEPFPPLAAAADILLNEPWRLFTGHGVETAVRGAEAHLLPARAPRTALFEIWYELGVIGAALSAALIWLGLRRVALMGEMVAPYFIAAIACDLALGVLFIDFSQMWWATVLAVAAISAAAAAHSQYRTARPLAGPGRPAL